MFYNIFYIYTPDVYPILSPKRHTKSQLLQVMPHKAGRRVAGHLRVLAAVREAQGPTPGLCQMAAALSVRGAQQKVLQDAGATPWEDDSKGVPKKGSGGLVSMDWIKGKF